MKFLMVCDFRENLNNMSTYQEVNIFNDHPTLSNIHDLINSISSLGYECDYFGGIPELINAVDTKQIFDNTFFLNFTDGMDQEYSRVQAPVLLDIINVPYSGSSTFPTALMNNKHYTKYALKDIPVHIAKSIIITNIDELEERVFNKFNYPLFIKPNCEGSSLGISSDNICHSFSEVKDKSLLLLNTFCELIIEEFIVGQDVTDFIIGNPNDYKINDVILAELENSTDFTVYGMREKTLKKRTLYWNTEKLSAALVEQIQFISKEIFEQLQASDIIRIDYRIQKGTNKLYFIEANSMPRFSRTSEVGFLCQKRNISFEQALKYYIDVSLARNFS